MCSQILLDLLCAKWPEITKKINKYTTCTTASHTKRQPLYIFLRPWAAWRNWSQHVLCIRPIACCWVVAFVLALILDFPVCEHKAGMWQHGINAQSFWDVTPRYSQLPGKHLQVHVLRCVWLAFFWRKKLMLIRTGIMQRTYLVLWTIFALNLPSPRFPPPPPTLAAPLSPSCQT